MLTKNQFIKRLQYLQDYDARVNKFDLALQEFAPSDFTGFYDADTHNYIFNTIAEDMASCDDQRIIDVVADILSWWLYDNPSAGKNPAGCKVWLGDPDNPKTEVLIIDTPEKLYQYLFDVVLEESGAEKL